MKGRKYKAALASERRLKTKKKGSSKILFTPEHPITFKVPRPHFTDKMMYYTATTDILGEYSCGSDPAGGMTH
jgi:hypothetical protein